MGAFCFVHEILKPFCFQLEPDGTEHAVDVIRWTPDDLVAVAKFLFRRGRTLIDENQRTNLVRLAFDADRISGRQFDQFGEAGGGADPVLAFFHLNQVAFADCVAEQRRLPVDRQLAGLPVRAGNEFSFAIDV